MWARSVNLEIRGNRFVIVYSDDIGVRVTPAHVFSQTDSYIFVVCPNIGLFAVLEKNNLVAFGVGFHNLLGLCGGCSADFYCSSLEAAANVQSRQSILKASQPRDLVVKPLTQLHNFSSAYRLPADRKPLLPASNAPACRRIVRTFSTHTLASEADGKDVVKFHNSVTVSVSDCVLLGLKGTTRLAIGQASWEASLPIPT